MFKKMQIWPSRKSWPCFYSMTCSKEFSSQQRSFMHHSEIYLCEAAAHTFTDIKILYCVIYSVFFKVIQCQMKKTCPVNVFGCEKQ